ncbi:hypothetical protein DVA67_017815 [Solirubrobacter sp. CPCC 204708]|uniref:Uncharacterized protein n=1 Tax=Solirubrobacter deserti TaxID=2282478 RepID=A0ABT4RCW0_9ACTN|nr:hypothetical protein [Solirubrobacter deserti]MBE2317844.1 hypothetical protein [Solirubrobacter deserti]MDA0136379.1 hypothetical protein [Solirubrobacter deserti]
MRYEQTFAAELRNFERPNWDPLLDLVGAHLVRFFMWMSEFEVDGVHAHAYKHAATRQYLYIGEDGRLFELVGRFRYRVADRRRALEQVFEEWEGLSPEPDEAARAELERLRRRAAS